MNHTSAGYMPSLAHPLIVSPAQGFENKKKLQPPFSHIDLNWDGFTLSHRHWVAIKIFKDDLSDGENLRRVQITLLHERCHEVLAHTPFSRHKKYKILALDGIIFDTFTKGQEQIEVPVKTNVAGNELQKQLALIKYLHEASDPVEEVFAVRSSLLEALKIGIIKNDDIRQQLIARYKQKYEKTIPIFPLTYDALDFVVGKIGENAAKGMIFSVLGTLNPILAFSDIISVMTGIVIPTNWLSADSTEWNAPPNTSFKFLWKLSEKLTNKISKLSFGEACHCFSGLINAQDTEASHLYGKAGVLDHEVLDHEEAMLKHIGETLSKNFGSDGVDDFLKSDSFKSLYGSPNSFVFTAYTDFIFPFSLLKYDDLKAAGVISEFQYGDLGLVVEAIMQQLTTGIGLLCPFWIDKPPTCPPTCCSSQNRELLEKVWNRTSPTPSCKTWKRMGCLAKAPVVQG